MVQVRQDTHIENVVAHHIALGYVQNHVEIHMVVHTQKAKENFAGEIGIQNVGGNR